MNPGAQLEALYSGEQTAQAVWLMQRLAKTEAPMQRCEADCCWLEQMTYLRAVQHPCLKVSQLLADLFAQGEAQELVEDKEPFGRGGQLRSSWSIQV